MGAVACQMTPPVMMATREPALTRSQGVVLLPSDIKSHLPAKILSTGRSITAARLVSAKEPIWSTHAPRGMFASVDTAAPSKLNVVSS